MQKLATTILDQNSKLIQAHNVFSQSNFSIRKTTGKSVSNTTGNNVFRNDKKNESTFKRMTDWKN